MSWIVIGEDKNQLVKLVSSKNTPGVLPKGSYLTIVEDGTDKPLYILRVETSATEFPYSPSSFIIDLGFEGLSADKKWQNIIYARIVRDLDEREDGLINPVLPRQRARRANQEEVNMAMELDGADAKGPKVFLATVHNSKNQILIDENQKYLYTHLNPEFFYHQTLVVGKTGSGKTVATKYLAQYFVEELKGAVLAINVKDVDFLKMDKPSDLTTPSIEREWQSLGENPHGVRNFTVYHPSTVSISKTKKVSALTIPITLDVKTIDPDALVGLLRNITDQAAAALPKIFNYWREEEKKKGIHQDVTFRAFAEWIREIHYAEKEEKDRFPILYSMGESETKLASSTVENILRNLDNALEFFDDPNAQPIDPEEVMLPSSMSVIDIQDEKSKIFGAILLRHLLHAIVERKSNFADPTPILIIIDEVHHFYSEGVREALGDLDTICREGRSHKIGVMFSSQTPADIPSGLSSVINTKLIFKSDGQSVRSQGIPISEDEVQTLKSGYACVNIHDMSQLRLVKFPLSYSGVVKNE